MKASEALLLDGSPLMRPDAVTAMQRHAVEAFPEEALGFIDSEGRYQRLENVSPEPERYAYAPKGTVPGLLMAGELRALCHSHPMGLDAPSEPDMRAQMELERPFVLCATDGQGATTPFAWGDQLDDRRELWGRGFRHAVDDCYAMIRAFWWREHGVRLPDYPRNWEWWFEETRGEKDLYARYFRDAGFYEIDRSEVRPGDAWMAAIRSTVPNHAGVVLEGGLALHHVSGGRAHDPMRLSRREPMAKWASYVTHWVRRD